MLPVLEALVCLVAGSSGTLSPEDAPPDNTSLRGLCWSELLLVGCVRPAAEEDARLPATFSREPLSLSLASDAEGICGEDDDFICGASSVSSCTGVDGVDSADGERLEDTIGNKGMMPPISRCSRE